LELTNLFQVMVPTEAELAEREGREYETADQLLKRIKTEKVKLEAKMKRNKLKKKKDKHRYNR